jgi:hypothetical protein
MCVGASAQTTEFYLPATGDSEAGSYCFDFDTPITDNEAWTIFAQTLYKGEAANATWGSRLFHAYRQEDPSSSGTTFTSESLLCFYMRPPVGAPGATTSNTGKLLLANGVANTPDVLEIDMVNGTLFTFQIISDGTGTVLVNIWVDGNNGGNPYTKTYVNNEIGTIYGVAAGQNYDVEGYLTLGASTPILTKPADVNFRTVFLNKTATKKLKVGGVNVVGSITGAISGKNASAFNLKTASAPSDGELEIEYTPTGLAVDSALLTLSSQNADPVVINLLGEGGEAPITISSEDNSDEHWYYVQFVRRNGEATVWTAGAKGDSIYQKILTPGSDLQQWKVYGDWDEYVVISKSGSEMDYNTTDDVYLNEEAMGGNYFGLVRYKTTADWQLQNIDKAFVNAETGDDVAGRNYVNDYQGKAICAYTIDDSGNQLVFVPIAAEKLFAGPDSIGFGTVSIGFPSTKRYPIVKLNITGDVQCAFSGNDAGVFSAEIVNDSLYITLDPEAAIEYGALLTVSAGQQSRVIKLTGTGFQIPSLPFRVSEGTNEYWYQIQFNRQSTKAFQDNGVGDLITQVEKVDDQANQLWKITGIWDNYRIVANSGNEFKYDTGVSRYVAAASGGGDRFGIRFNDSDGWAEFYNITINTTGSYMNDFGGNGGSELGHYYHNDGGAKINFLATFASIGASGTLPFGEIEAGASFTKEMTVTSSLLTSVITYALSGDDASAFTVEAVEDEDEDTPVLDPNTLYQEGGKLRIVFAPTAKKAYEAKLTFSATGADDVEVTLTGTADFALPVQISTAAVENWYTLSFSRKSTKVWAVDEFNALVQIAKPTGEPTDAHLWKFTGTPAEGYQIVSKTGGAIVYPPTSTTYIYELTGVGEAGDKHQFLRAGNGTDWQLYNLTTDGTEYSASNDRYVNDFQGTGLSAGLYYVDDGGNYLIFTLVSSETSIHTPDLAGDVVAATRYYTLQGLEVKKPGQTGIYIKQDLYASGRVKASKVYILIR